MQADGPHDQPSADKDVVDDSDDLVALKSLVKVTWDADYDHAKQVDRAEEEPPNKGLVHVLDFFGVVRLGCLFGRVQTRVKIDLTVPNYRIRILDDVNYAEDDQD